MDPHTEEFCRLVRERSAEHERAMPFLFMSPSVAVSVLRQELDSVVRVLYLLSTRDRPQRLALVRATLDGNRWEDTSGGRRRKITDRDMVDRAQLFTGWTASLYRFACAFIHLSKFHDHKARDPFRALPPVEQDQILAHLRYNQGGRPEGDAPTFRDIAPLFPLVLMKLSSNLERYIVQLEGDGDLESG